MTSHRHGGHGPLLPLSGHGPADAGGGQGAAGATPPAGGANGIWPDMQERDQAGEWLTTAKSVAILGVAMLAITVLLW